MGLYYSEVEAGRVVDEAHIFLVHSQANHSALQMLHCLNCKAFLCVNANGNLETPKVGFFEPDVLHNYCLTLMKIHVD